MAGTSPAITKVNHSDDWYKQLLRRLNHRRCAVHANVVVDVIVPIGDDHALTDGAHADEIGGRGQPRDQHPGGRAVDTQARGVRRRGHIVQCCNDGGSLRDDVDADRTVAGCRAVAHGEADSARAAWVAPHKESIGVIVKLDVAERDTRGGRANSPDRDPTIRNSATSVFRNYAIRYVKLASDTGRYVESN